MLIKSSKFKIANLFLLFFLINGCQSSSYKHLFPSLRYAFLGQEDVEVSRETIDAIPYASISGKIGKGQNSVLILGLVDNENLGWYSADRKLFVTTNGRLTKTEGLTKNLSRTHFLGKDPVARHTYSRALPKTAQRLLDFDDDSNYGVLIDSYYEVLGRGTIEIAGISYDTYVLKETNIAKNFDWKFENLFWKDVETGFVWKSKQYFEPNSPPITIEVLKPFAP